MPRTCDFHPREQMKVEIMTTCIASHEECSRGQKGGPRNEKTTNVYRRPQACWLPHGTSRSVCLVTALTAPSLKGMAKVFPLYQ
jgi:hypothetical protein